MVEILYMDNLDRKEMEAAAEMYIDKWGAELLMRENNIRNGHRLSEEIVNQLVSRASIFPRGQLALWGGKRKGIVGIINSIRRYLEDPEEMAYDTDFNQWLRLTDWGYFGSYDRDGNILFCVSICAKEREVGGKKVSAELIKTALEFSEDWGTKMYAYSRPSRFRESRKRSVQRYLEAVRTGKIRDPIGMHMHYSGSEIDDLIIIPGGRLADKESRGYIIAVPYKNGFSPHR